MCHNVDFSLGFFRVFMFVCVFVCLFVRVFVCEQPASDDLLPGAPSYRGGMLLHQPCPGVDVH